MSNPDGLNSGVEVVHETIPCEDGGACFSLIKHVEFTCQKSKGKKDGVAFVSAKFICKYDIEVDLF